MIFEENYILENEKVILRPLEMTDFEHLLPFSINEPEIWTYSLIQANGAEKLRKYIDIAVQNRKERKEYTFIVFDKVNQKYAGSTRFYDVQYSQLTTQLGFTWYGKEFQGTGLNKNCKFLMLEFAFEKLNFERVEFRADNRNQRSINAMKSIGCIEEGILRSNGFDPFGNRRDSIVLSILKQEWFESVKENLATKLNN
jgi:RimJ/RimL family protein N-acetyltransferase